MQNLETAIEAARTDYEATRASMQYEIKRLAIRLAGIADDLDGCNVRQTACAMRKVQREIRRAGLHDELEVYNQTREVLKALEALK